MSPNKRYIRFEGYTSVSSSSIQSSFKAFDTKNGIEITWHKINLNSLEQSCSNDGNSSSEIYSITNNIPPLPAGLLYRYHILTSIMLYSSSKHL